jgi:uncharacterized protein YuzE
MDALKILPNLTDQTTWDYDDEADVLYISIGQPTEAISIDIGDGTLMRYVESEDRLVGITVIGLKARLARELNDH